MRTVDLALGHLIKERADFSLNQQLSGSEYNANYDPQSERAKRGGIGMGIRGMTCENCYAYFSASLVMEIAFSAGWNFEVELTKFAVIFKAEGKVSGIACTKRQGSL